LWPELARVPKAFVLYGGTALALRLGHRTSVDFDFFHHAPLKHDVLDREVPWLREATALQEEPNARTVLAATAYGTVKVSFFGTIGFGRVGEPQTTQDGVLRVASLLDLAGTKVKALLQRVESKDYVDIAALLGAGLSTAGILGAARTLFGPAFNPLAARKALTWFEGGDLAQLPEDVRKTLVDAATRDAAVATLPLVSDRLD
jgi:hypothetical protein